MVKNGAAKAEVRTKTTWKNAMKRDWQLYVLLLVPLALVFIFNFMTYPGLRVAFMDYKPAKGYDGSEWVGMETFAKIFKDADFTRALRNSVVFNVLDLVIGFPVPIILALILNELRYPKFKKGAQTILSAALPFLGNHWQRCLYDVQTFYRFGEYGVDGCGDYSGRYSFSDRKMALGCDLPVNQCMADHGMGNYFVSRCNHRY